MPRRVLLSTLLSITKAHLNYFLAPITKRIAHSRLPFYGGRKKEVHLLKQLHVVGGKDGDMHGMN